MTILEQLVTSFISAAAFGIIFNIPKESLLKSGFIGMIGWILYFIMTTKGMDEVPSTVIAAFVIAIISHIYAKMYKTPIIIFTVAGIIPLVPGGMAFNTMRYFVQNQYNDAINLAAKAFMISGAIAIGIIFAEVISELIRKLKIEKPSRR
jgi:uncharacterized membrane protein YjjB (DUF3815 family)